MYIEAHFGFNYVQLEMPRFRDISIKLPVAVFCRNRWKKERELEGNCFSILVFPIDGRMYTYFDGQFTQRAYYCNFTMMSDDVTNSNSSWYKTFKNHFLGRRLQQELKSNLGTYLFEKKGVSKKYVREDLLSIP